MKTINYTGSSKLISRIVHLLNRKAPLPLDGDGDAVWGTNGQVLTTDGQGNTSWTTPQGGGGDVTDVEVNGTSVVNAQGVAEVTVPTKTSDLNNDSDFIDSTDLSTALADYTPTASLASVATSGQYSDLSGTPSLATVATSGDYDDLLNKPSIPSAQVQSDWSQADNTADDYIKNKPTIPTALADLSEDTTHRVVTDTEKTTWNGKVSDNPTFTEAATRANIASGESFATILGKIKKFFTDLKTVAFTGNYSDLSGTPDLSNVAYKNINNNFTESQTINRADGTAGTAGSSFLTVGNNKSSSVAGNSTGGITIYGDGTARTNLTAKNASANRDINFPNASGTVALQSINNNFTDSQTIDRQNGTTSSVGISVLALGNATAEGTDKNSQGQITLYGKGTNYGYIRATNVTGNRAYEMPDYSGTIALQEYSAVADKKNIAISGSVQYTLGNGRLYLLITGASNNLSKSAFLINISNNTISYIPLMDSSYGTNISLSASGLTLTVNNLSSSISVKASLLLVY